ncbi:hypothetical protein B0H94_10764 [Salsuginibacillus halophilus]|uniref:YqeG family HAD IIIA-type phosphatase n=1 Tax=Salsuginibacillus halophilus TaxID=517424 RepID=A0A2P8HFQ6_9BACI|nr:YqeG family HAD IIIA-type phosphatase [Salsuginibacillus halophilus]PSL45059.1 hypothetical protein B0H94_10764 [Salsuginibacillus halophilus]
MLTKFVPDQFVPSVYDINLEDLAARGFQGVITDLDNTLVEWDRPEATPALMEWFEQVKKAGLKLTIVSNNNESRVRAFSEPHGITFIHSARKPSRRAFRRACAEMDTKTTETVVVGDQLLTDILGGNRGGYYTILVKPVTDSDNIFTKVNRSVERRVLKRLKKRGYNIEAGGKTNDK